MDQPASQVFEDEESSFDIKGLLFELLRKSWIILLAATIAGSAATWYARRIPDSFSSSVTVQIESEERKPINVQDSGSQNLKDPDTVGTILQNLKNRSLLLRVSEALDLQNDRAFHGADGRISSEAVLVRLRDDMTVIPRPKTRLVDIGFIHTDPKVACRVAHTIVDQFLKLQTEQRLKAIEMQNGVLVEKSAELKGKLEKAELALQDYKKKLGFVPLDEMRTAANAELNKASAELDAVRRNLKQMEQDRETVNQAGGHPEKLRSIVSVANDPDVKSTSEKVSFQQGEIAALGERYRWKHPKMIAAQARLKELEKAASDALLAVPVHFEALYDSTKSLVTRLEVSLEQKKKALIDIDEKLIPLRALQREEESNRTLYQAVLQRLNESTLAKGIDSVSFRIVEPAVQAYRMPNKRALILVGGVIGGGGLGVALIAVLFFLNSSLRTVDQAERLLRLPVLAAVPALRKAKSPSQLFVTLAAPDSAATESIRSLRTSLSFAGAAEKSKVIIITSAVPGEGKTLTATNLAIAFAQQELRTLLIDADLRRPMIGKMFNIRTDVKGLAECLGGHPPQFTRTHVTNLVVLPAGNATSPAELLAGSRFSDFVACMQEHFDRIVIDTAPINVVSDTLNFVKSATAICLVVRSGQTSVRVIRRAIELLRRMKVRPTGVALNFMPQASGAGYYYHYSSGGKYGSESTYGAGFNPTGAPVAASTEPGLRAAQTFAPLPSQRNI